MPRTAGQPGATRLGRVVREAREKAGLSARALAARAGLAHVTVSAVERGREPGASTLRALIDALPGLRPEHLLGGAGPGAPATTGAWNALASLFGFEARLARLVATVRTDGRVASDLVVDGLRPTRGSLADRDRRMAVLGAPLIGPALELAAAADRHPSPAGRRHVLRLGDVEHSLWLPRRLDGGEARYRRKDLRPVAPEEALAEHSPHGRPFVRGACAWLDHPVRRLVLTVRFPPGAAPPSLRVVAWPATLATAPGEGVDAWPLLYPHAARIVLPLRDEATLAIDLPPPGTCFALAWDAPEEQRRARSPLRVRPLARRPVSAVLRDAREGLGLSRREAARRMGVSAASVVEAERGRDPRLGFLARAIAHLPGLTAAELLARDEDDTRSIDDIRDDQARLFGLLADEEACTVVITPSGDARIEMRRVGLRPLVASARRVRLRLGSTRGMQTARQWEVEGLDATGGADDATVRVVSRDRGPTVHELRFLAASADRPLTHVRRFTVRGQVAMSRDADGATLDAAGRRAEAVYMEPSLPSRLLRLRVVLPRGYWPDEISASAVPRACGPSWRPDDVSLGAHPEGLRLAIDPARRRIELEVARPVVGLRYQVLWFLR